MGSPFRIALVGVLLTCAVIAGLYLHPIRKSKGVRQVASQEPNTSVIKTKLGVEMVLIPGGSFEMGNDSGAPDEAPVHKVAIAPFLMDRYEVTQELFAKVELPDPSHFKAPKNPVDQANWTDAARFCNERSRAEGLQPCYDEEKWQCNFEADGYRLPTEAEWECACRAGTAATYSFGDNPLALKEYAWFSENAGKKTHPVGQKKPNAWGLYDMHGNVAEWCNDIFDKEYYHKSPASDPRGPESGAREKIVRGGAWNSSAASCRSSYRSGDPSLNDTCLASDALGFRCVRRQEKKP